MGSEKVGTVRRRGDRGTGEEEKENLGKIMSILLPRSPVPLFSPPPVDLFALSQLQRNLSFRVSEIEMRDGF